MERYFACWLVLEDRTYRHRDRAAREPGPLHPVAAVAARVHSLGPDPPAGTGCGSFAIPRSMNGADLALRVPRARLSLRPAPPLPISSQRLGARWREKGGFMPIRALHLRHGDALSAVLRGRRGGDRSRRHLDGAGAGMGNRLWLPDFPRGAGFGRFTRLRGSLGSTFRRSPTRGGSTKRSGAGLGFDGHRSQLYLRRGAARGLAAVLPGAQRRYGAAVFTSNVDGQRSEGGLAAAVVSRFMSAMAAFSGSACASAV